MYVWVDKLISFSFITTLLLLRSALRHQHMRNAQLSANDVTRIEHAHTHMNNVCKGYSGRERGNTNLNFKFKTLWNTFSSFTQNLIKFS